jgi:hypothetical protein
MNKSIVDFTSSIVIICDPKHPMRIKKGVAKGKMPHEMATEASFKKWLLLNGMTETLYRANLKRGQAYLQKISENTFKRVSKARLTPDQKGWAQIDFPVQFLTDGFWLINPDKPSRPIPEPTFVVLRNIVHQIDFDTKCGCNEDFTLYGKTYNDIMLVRCSKCKSISIS